MIGLLCDLYRWATRPPHVHIPAGWPERHRRCVCGHGETSHAGNGGACHYCGCSYMQTADTADAA